MHKSILKDTLFSNKLLDQGQVDPCRHEIAPGFGSEHILAGTSDPDVISVLLLQSEESQVLL